MKKILLPIAAITLLLSFTKITFEPKASAEVDQIQGCFIFVNAKPLTSYEFLGTVTLSKKEGRKDIKTGQYEDVRDALLKKLKIKFPQADGVIFHFHDGDTDLADAIKFK